MKYLKSLIRNNPRTNKYKWLFITLVVLTITICGSLYHFRFDLTSEKRYSISTQSKQLLSTIDAPLEVTIYLDGDLNPSFQRLKKSAKDLIDEFEIYSKKSIHVRFVNPHEAGNDELRNKLIHDLSAKGITPTEVYERDKEGKSVQKIVFPWAELHYKNKSVQINLLRNVRGNTGDVNLNISIENLEFEFHDGIKRLTNREISKIAFIEGHGELNEAETYDISKSLSKYFQVDRGILANDASVLDTYKTIIIARPTKPFSESDKYIIDQYIMNGGSVLWLIDPVRIARENLSVNGLSPAIERDLNLNDQLFKYGIRINPVIIQDVQCINIPVNIAPAKANPQFEASPWFYSPLLLTSPQHLVSRNISEVKADFCSMIDLVGENTGVKSSLLLASSTRSHIVGTPTTIDVGKTPKANDKDYFNLAYVPVAVAMEGNFDSNFAHRLSPNGLVNTLPVRVKSSYTKQIFIADGDIIRNETNGIPSDSTTLPLGFDRYMNQQFGNKDFLLNAVLYLADNDGWMELRNRNFKLRLLNKGISSDEKNAIQWLNLILPLIIWISFGTVFLVLRKRKYHKK